MCICAPEVLRKTTGKPTAAKLKRIRRQLRVRLHEKTRGTAEQFQTVVAG